MPERVRHELRGDELSVFAHAVAPLHTGVDDGATGTGDGGGLTGERPVALSIRWRCRAHADTSDPQPRGTGQRCDPAMLSDRTRRVRPPVSYTHLTLPTN